MIYNGEKISCIVRKAQILNNKLFYNEKKAQILQQEIPLKKK